MWYKNPDNFPCLCSCQRNSGAKNSPIVYFIAYDYDAPSVEDAWGGVSAYSDTTFICKLSDIIEQLPEVFL